MDGPRRYSILQVIKEFSELAPNDSQAANKFFQKFGPGNSIFRKNNPYERLSIYEYLLKVLLTNDLPKYQAVHKGTPFYFMAWLAFDLKNYEKALYYIDAAISEDIRVSQSDWLNYPASNFLTLQNTKVQVAARTITLINSSLSNELARFNSISGLKSIDVNSFIARFVSPLLRDTPKRTIVSAFYVFLLEYSERYIELQMRSLGGGSIAPFILHLFSGALIFETILKNLFPFKDKGIPSKTLGDVFNSQQFQGIYTKGISTSANSFSEIFTGITNNSLLTAFTTTAKIRNTTGHNFIWDETLASPSQYQRLFEQVVNSILYIVCLSY